MYIIGGHNADELEAFDDFGANWAWFSIDCEVGVVVRLHVERLEFRRDDFQQARVQENVVDVGLRSPVEGLGLGRGTWAMRGRISRVVAPCVWISDACPCQKCAFDSLTNFGTNVCGLGPSAECGEEGRHGAVGALLVGQVLVAVECRRCHLSGRHGACCSASGRFWMLLVADVLEIGKVPVPVPGTV